MDFYPKHNRSVYEDLKTEYQKGNLIPFVGAGLSVFCGYKSWPSVLKELAEFVYSAEKRAQIEALITQDKLPEAAQMIYDNYSRMLKELSKIIGYEKISNCDESVLHASATYVLPYLFKKNLVMTTNFDRVLEEVYNKHRASFGRIINPYEPDVLTQVRQGGAHSLFKLHGDIGPDTHDIEKLVFTKTQYDKAYSNDSALVQELLQWFQNKRLLFLGCSLAMDKTMEVLQMAMEKNEALNHYAILSCKTEDIELRMSKIGKLGISAVFYPEGKHDAVRVVLERLLEETDHHQYEELCRSKSNSSPEFRSRNRFMYDSEYVAFFGRENELESLSEFCKNPEHVAWWAVVGPGGMGKSRLVYEFTKMQKSLGWNVLWLTRNDYHNLWKIRLPIERCIVVADDVQEHFQAVGKWLVSVFSSQRSEKLRVLLVERDGKSLNSAKWVETLQADAPYDRTIYSRCYCDEFLQLNTLEEEDLKAIMMSFAEASGKPLNSSDRAKRLLQVLQKIDGNLQRPLYALAITDAWCCGKDPYRWNKTQVLDTLVMRELDFYYKRLQGISGKGISNRIRTEFEKLVAKSCVMPFVSLDHISEEEYPKLSKKADELDLEFSEMLEQIGVVRRVKLTLLKSEMNEDNKNHGQEMTKEFDAVVFDCPDLVKEHLVLQQAFDKGQNNLLFPEKWDSSFMQLAFIQRILRDYPKKLEGKEWFWNSFFDGNPTTGLPAWTYSSILFGITMQIPEMKKQVVERLIKLQGIYCADEQIAIDLAWSLFSLTTKREAEDCVQSVKRLENLHHQFRNCEEIADSYAKSLVNLMATQQIEDCKHSVLRLEELYRQFCRSEEIALAYANGLGNLLIQQEFDDYVQNVYRLVELHNQFPNNEVIALSYAQVLVNLTADQGFDDCSISVKHLKCLFDQFHNNEEITLSYAKGLTNLAMKRELSDCIQNVLLLENLHNEFSDNREVAHMYMYGLINLSFLQKEEMDVLQTLKRAKRLLTQYSENEVVRLGYAQVLFNLTLKQSSDNLKETIEELQKYLQENPKTNAEFQTALHEYLDGHPEHIGRYVLLQ